jgi:hypothetical protein
LKGRRPASAKARDMAAARKWTPDVRAFIEETYPTTRAQDLVPMLAERFGLSITLGSLQQYLSAHGIKKRVVTRA